MINDRRILKGIFEEELGIRDPMNVYRAIDKLDKIGLEGVRGDLKRIGISETIIDKIINIISLRAPLEEAIRDLQARYGSNQHIIEGIKHLEEISAIVRSKNIVFDMSLVRGLDYYTGPIFEAIVEGIKIGSIGGGGRYDNLIEMFTGTKVPATGFSIGLDRVIEVGLELGVFNMSKKTYNQVYVVVMDRDSRVFNYAINIVRDLRSNGISVSWDLMRRSYQKQREYARKLLVPVILYIGKAEVESGKVTIYITTSGERREIEKGMLVKTLKEILGI